MIRLIFLLFLLPHALASLELNLICTNKVNNRSSVDVNDLFLILDSYNKRIELGGLSFTANELKITDTNVSWSAEKIALYPETQGRVNGIIGRFSGDLRLEFIRNDNGRASAISFKCKKINIRDRIF